MSKPGPIQHEHYPDTYHNTYSRTVFGFWLFLLSDFILFGTIFAAYAVLRNNVFGGPSAKDIFNFPFMLSQTIILLTSSFTAGLAGAAAHRKNKNHTIALFVVTFILGLIFVGMELADFNHLISAGHSWKRSAFLSVFFTLMGTHWVHMLFAILWIPVFLVPVWREGITPASVRRLTCLKMLWQFLNIVWIFIFAFCLSDGGKVTL